MATATHGILTLSDLLERLGGISPSRVRFEPPPGTAVEADVLEVERREDRLCELVDGVLVEKAMGYRESILAVALATHLRAFVVPRNLGLVSGADGMMRLFPGLVRIPDVAYVAWDRLPGRRIPDEPLPGIAPTLAVEVLIKSNTPAEMERKLGEYFAAGAKLAWLIDPEARRVTVHQGPGRSVVLGTDVTLDGGEVLPGFQLELRDLFAELDRQAPHRPLDP